MTYTADDAARDTKASREQVEKAWRDAERDAKLETDARRRPTTTTTTRT